MTADKVATERTSPSSQQPQDSQASQWARTRERGSYGAMRLLVFIYRYGGNLLLSPILYGVVFYFFITRPATRRHSRLYLERAMPGKASGWQVWRHHLMFARALMARIRAWLGKLQPDEVSFPQRNAMWARKKRGEGIIFLGAHMGNLDMCRAITQPGHSYKLNVIVHTRNARKFNKLLQQINPDNEISLIQVDQITPETAMLLHTKLDAGEAVVLLADRVPSGTESRHYAAEFLGSEARFPVGPFWLATLLDAPVFFMSNVDRGGENYQMIVEPLRDQREAVGRRQREQKARELFQAYVTQLEQMCRDYPLQWFNFYDFWLDDVHHNHSLSVQGSRSNSNP